MDEPAWLELEYTQNIAQTHFPLSFLLEPVHSDKANTETTFEVTVSELLSLSQ